MPGHNHNLRANRIVARDHDDHMDQTTATLSPWGNRALCKIQNDHLRGTPRTNTNTLLGFMQKIHYYGTSPRTLMNTDGDQCWCGLWVEQLVP